MKLLLKTLNAEALKASIIEMIEDKELETWLITTIESVKYLKHTGQWGEKGVINLEADNTSGHLSVQVFKFERVPDDVKDFEGYYLGRFCEIIFVNFPEKFSAISKG